VELNDQSLLYDYSLGNNYPNPFNPVTKIKYSIKYSGIVTIKVYTALGEEIKTLVNDIKAAGNYEVEFSTNNLPSGVYLYKLQCGQFATSKKMLLLK